MSNMIRAIQEREKAIDWTAVLIEHTNIYALETYKGGPIGPGGVRNDVAALLNGKSQEEQNRLVLAGLSVYMDASAHFKTLVDEFHKNYPPAKR